jgi:hypothetical protein
MGETASSLATSFTVSNGLGVDIVGEREQELAELPIPRSERVAGVYVPSRQTPRTTCGFR